MRIICVGLNHKSAAIGLRERVALDSVAAGVALRDLAARWPGSEFVIVSTCNRTEVYAARAVHDHPRKEELELWLAQRGQLDGHQLEGAVYCLSDAQAAGHLFEVAAGMDSLVPGEPHIVGQLKEAYAAALEGGFARTGMHELFQAAFHVAKHIRSETRIATGKASVASAAVDCVLREVGRGDEGAIGAGPELVLQGLCVLCVGAGEMAELMLRRLVRLGVKRVFLTNRTHGKAIKLAGGHEGADGLIETVPFERLAQCMENADVVLTSTASAVPIISGQMIQDVQERRGYRRLLIVDIAVPRDVGQEAGLVRGVKLYNIDDLQEVVRETLETRQSQCQPAQKIVQRHVTELMDKLNVRQVAPTIEALYRFMREIADGELADAQNKLSSHADADLDGEVLKRSLHRTIRRIMHPLARQLQKAAAQDGAGVRIATVLRLFELGEDRPKAEG
jgi:glutamyl-tRNA reductase